MKVVKKYFKITLDPRLMPSALHFSCWIIIVTWSWKLSFGVFLNISFKKCQESLPYRWSCWGSLSGTYTALNWIYQCILLEMKLFIHLPSPLDYMILEGRSCFFPISWHIVIPQSMFVEGCRKKEKHSCFLLPKPIILSDKDTKFVQNVLFLKNGFAT